MISEARRPVIYAGGGVVSSAGEAELTALAEKLGCPGTTTIMGLGAMAADHPLWLHVLGMHGSYTANVAVNEADLVIALGVRFDDRVTGNVEAFIADGQIIHIDIDRNEINKNKTVTLGITADLRTALAGYIAAKYLAPQEISGIGIIGSGGRRLCRTGHGFRDGYNGAL